MAPLIAETLSVTWPDGSPVSFKSILDTILRWLANLAASLLWALWHGTGLDHLCQMILHILKIVAITVSIFLITPLAIFVAFKTIIWLFEFLLPLIFEAVAWATEKVQHSTKSKQLRQPPSLRPYVVFLPNDERYLNAFNPMAASLRATGDFAPARPLADSGYGTFNSARSYDPPPPCQRPSADPSAKPSPASVAPRPGPSGKPSSQPIPHPSTDGLAEPSARSTERKPKASSTAPSPKPPLRPTQPSQSHSIHSSEQHPSAHTSFEKWYTLTTIVLRDRGSIKRFPWPNLPACGQKDCIRPVNPSQPCRCTMTAFLRRSPSFSQKWLRRELRRWHPDKFPDPVKKSAEEMFKLIGQIGSDLFEVT